MSKEHAKSNISDAIEELYELKVDDKIINLLDEAKGYIDDIEERDDDEIDKLKEEIEELEEKLDEVPEYNATIKAYEEIHFTATNFKDREMIEALEDALSRNVTVERITQLLQII